MILEIIFISLVISFLVMGFGMFLAKKGYIKENKFTKDENNNHIPEIVEEKVKQVKKKITKK